ncbi:hypothetical protein DSM106972_094580 [Dulcicalothrix desertica PCC 7102]|uniref:CARDB domain-containing protein n=2 Tax=Dulcicalothrix desertica TaxID=32056 RepID=A0A3S1A5E2_9CYAN|nr:hypothetical protein DSM106972_094580 [Dulcicalothrix desertica PCC 7102]
MLSLTMLRDVAAAPTKPDISCRPVLYFGGKPGKLEDMNKGSRGVGAGQKIILTSSDSVLQSNGKYAFNVGYYLFAKPDKQAPSLPKFTNRLFIGNKEIVNQHSVKFSGKRNAGGGAIEAIHTQVYLPKGENVVVLSLDDDKLIDESNKENNTHSFTVVVKP